MSITIELPESIESAFAKAARSQGLSMDQFVRNFIVSHAHQDLAFSAAQAQWIDESGIPMLEFTLPNSYWPANDPMEQTRLERDLSNMGLLGE